MSSDKVSLEGLRIDRTAIPARAARPAWVVPALGGGLLVAALGVWWIAQPKAITVETAEVRAVTASSSSPSGGGGTTGAGSAPRTTLLNATGYVTARREATVSSKVTGKVVEAYVEEGMSVKEGQELARLDDSNVAASLALAEAQLESSRRTIEETRPALDFALQEVKRFTELSATRATSQSDLNKAQAEAKTQQARLERQEADLIVAQREVATWKQQMDDTVIRAPFAGMVTSKNAQPGEMISPMSAGGFTRTGICTLVDMSSLEIEVDVSESYINRVVPGQPVEAALDAYSGWTIPAEVIAIIPTADRQKATVKVRIGFEKLDPRILPEMGVKVAFLEGGPEPASSTNESGETDPEPAALPARPRCWCPPWLCSRTKAAPSSGSSVTTERSAAPSSSPPPGTGRPPSPPDSKPGKSWWSNPPHLWRKGSE
jgi:RND family efflux transporter MFP subunit